MSGVGHGNTAEFEGNIGKKLEKKELVENRSDGKYSEEKKSDEEVKENPEVLQSKIDALRVFPKKFVPNDLKSKKSRSPTKSVTKGKLTPVKRALANGSKVQSEAKEKSIQETSKISEFRVDLLESPEVHKSEAYTEKLPKQVEKSVSKIISPVKKPSLLFSKRKIARCASTDLVPTIDQLLGENCPFNNKPSQSFTSRKTPEKTKKNYDLSSSFTLHRRYNSSESLGLHTELSENSKELQKNLKKNENIYDRFYQIANKERPGVHEQAKKSPTRSSDQIDLMLYEDAVRRASIHYEPVENIEISTNFRSQQVLAKKFIKEYLENIEKLELPQGDFDLNSAYSLIIAFKFMKSTENLPEDSIFHKFWAHVSENSVISKEKLLAACMAILGIYPSKVELESFSQFKPQLNLSGIQDSFTLEEEIRLHKNFFGFYETRQILPKPVRTSSVEEHSHRPQLSEITEVLAKKRRNDMGEIGSQKRLDFFMQEKQKNLEKMVKAKQEKELQELSSCTFKPKILPHKVASSKVQPQEHRTLVLYEKSKQSKEKPLKTSQDIELEKNLAECTFAPKIKRVKLKEETEGLYSKSVQQNIARLQKAREEEARKKMILDGALQSRYLTQDSEDIRVKSPVKPFVVRPRSPEKNMPMIRLADGLERSD